MMMVHVNRCECWLLYDIFIRKLPLPLAVDKAVIILRTIMCTSLTQVQATLVSTGLDSIATCERCMDLQ